ncbi:MAG TPA: DUF3127 domain-containing protein [Bacteroidia bacterium]|nr:DUF3127 domain-containing protein [Bacteroidia bacterium]
MTGLLHNVSPKQVFKSDAVKKDFILSRTSGGPYPNVIFEVFGNEIIALLDSIPANTLVTVEFEIYGKSSTGKDGIPRYFNTFRAFNIIPVVDNTSVSVSENNQTVTEPKVN